MPDSESLLYQIKRLDVRFDNMERQLSDVRTAIVQMSKTEERVSLVLEQHTTLFKKLDDLTSKIQKLEKDNATQGQSINVFERFSWLVMTSLVGLAVWFFKK